MRADQPPVAPPADRRPGAGGRTAMGVFGGPITAWIDHSGAVQLTGRSWCLEWWIHAGDRWHFPTVEPTVRQRRLGAGPVVQTALRVPGGDIEHRAWMSQHHGRPVLVVEIENPTSTPVGLAVAVRPHDLDGRPADIATAVGTDHLRIDDRSGGTTLWSSVPFGDTLPDHTAAVVPLPHRSTVRLAGLPFGTSVGALGDSAAAARGWNALVTSSCRIVLPDDRLTTAFDQLRGRLSLGAHDLRRRIADLAPGAGDELAAVSLGGFDRQARQLVGDLVKDGWWPGRGGPAATAAVLDGLAWAVTLHAPTLAEALLEAAARLARGVPRGSPSSSRADAALARLAATIGRLEASGAIDDHHGLAPVTTVGPDALARMLEGASETGSWGHDDPMPAAGVVQAIRQLVVAEARLGTECELRFFPSWPAAWRGGPVEVHQLPTAFGRLSSALRWHGYRPALLWQLDAARVVRLRCPGLDRDWSSTDPTGEVLLAGTAGGLTEAPAEGESFS